MTATALPLPTRSVTSLAARLVAVLLAALAAVSTLGVGQAHADVALAGRTFHTEVECGGGFMTVTTNTAADNGGYVFLYVYDYRNARWFADTQWRAANAWAGFFTPNVPTSYGYYAVYAYYASWTGSQWATSGEFVTSFQQRSGNSSTRSAY